MLDPSRGVPKFPYNCFVPFWIDTHPEAPPIALEQAEKILELVRLLHDEGYDRVAMTYLIDDVQSSYKIASVYFGGEWYLDENVTKDIIIREIQRLLKEDVRYQNLQKVFYILPVPICVEANNKGNVLDHDFNYFLNAISSFIENKDEKCIALGLQDENGPYVEIPGKLTKGQVNILEERLTDLVDRYPPSDRINHLMENRYYIPTAFTLVAAPSSSHAALVTSMNNNNKLLSQDSAIKTKENKKLSAKKGYFKKIKIKEKYKQNKLLTPEKQARGFLSEAKKLHEQGHPKVAMVYFTDLDEVAMLNKKSGIPQNEREIKGESNEAKVMREMQRLIREDEQYKVLNKAFLIVAVPICSFKPNSSKSETVPVPDLETHLNQIDIFMKNFTNKGNVVLEWRNNQLAPTTSEAGFFKKKAITTYPYNSNRGAVNLDPNQAQAIVGRLAQYAEKYPAPQNVAKPVDNKPSTVSSSSPVSTARAISSSSAIFHNPAKEGTIENLKTADKKILAYQANKVFLNSFLELLKTENFNQIGNRINNIIRTTERLEISEKQVAHDSEKYAEFAVNNLPIIKLQIEMLFKSCKSKIAPVVLSDLKRDYAMASNCLLQKSTFDTGEAILNGIIKTIQANINPTKGMSGLQKK